MHRRHRREYHAIMTNPYEYKTNELIPPDNLRSDDTLKERLKAFRKKFAWSLFAISAPFLLATFLTIWFVVVALEALKNGDTYGDSSSDTNMSAAMSALHWLTYAFLITGALIIILTPMIMTVLIRRSGIVCPACHKSLLVSWRWRSFEKSGSCPCCKTTIEKPLPDSDGISVVSSLQMKRDSRRWRW